MKAEEEFKQDYFEMQFLHHSIHEPPINVIQMMGNWTRLADVLYTDAFDTVEIKQMIKYELENKGRKTIVMKLHARYRSLKSKDEKMRLTEWLKNRKRKLKRTSE